MGALLSQAVANQLRQAVGFQDPHPSPPTLIQQVLNPPGPSRPMWMAPVMENQQLMQTNTPEAQQALLQDAMKAALAFGGADITKEQRAAWEAENLKYRAGSGAQGSQATDVYQPGTRVKWRLLAARRGPTGEYRLGEGRPGDFGSGEGEIVRPGTPEAGRPLYNDPATAYDPRPPGPGWVAIRADNAPGWHWRNREALEILPPKEKFPVGTKVEYPKYEPGVRPGVLVQPWQEAEIGEPPRGEKSPGPNYRWVDYIPAEGAPTKSRGGWYHIDDLVKKGK